MKHCRWPIALALLFAGSAEIHAQIVFPIAGNFGTYTYKRGRLTVQGWYSEPYPIVAQGVSPFGPVVIGPVNPYAVGPLGGYFPGIPYGNTNSRITIQYITPAYVVSGAGLGQEYDIRGVDLDIVLAQKAEKARQEGLAAAPADKKAKFAGAADVAKLQPEPPPAQKRAAEKPAAEKPAPEVADLRVPPPPERPRPKKEHADEYSRLLDLGMTAFKAQEYGMAARHFQQAIATQPRTGRTYFLLAQAEFALGKYKAAAASIEAGLVRQPDWPAQAFQPRADLYPRDDNDFMTQVKRLEEAVTGQPKHGPYLFLLAYQLWFDGRRQEAGPIFQRARAVAIDPIPIDAFLRADKGVLAAN
jgi:tetratricopeptide (TPR) repeat protein